MIFCVILIFSALPCTAYADTAVITSGTMYSYFQTYNTSGTWVDLQTPAHWITATGEVAYCLQTSKDNPYNGGYYSIDGEDVYDDYVLTGLRAILTHGYPADSGGFDAQAARYATANAIRFWLAENYCDGVPQYLNLNVNGDWIRGKYGCEDLFDWCIGLLNLARSQTVAISDGSLTFNPPEISLTQNGQYFSGSAYLNTCTPYGVNTHRLLVRGERIGYTVAAAAVEDAIIEELPASTWTQEYLRGVGVGLMGIAALTAIVGGIHLRKTNCQHKKPAVYRRPAASPIALSMADEVVQRKAPRPPLIRRKERKKGKHEL